MALLLDPFPQTLANFLPLQTVVVGIQQLLVFPLPLQTLVASLALAMPLKRAVVAVASTP